MEAYIEELIIAIAPAITSIFAVVIAVVKLIAHMKKEIASVRDTVDAGVQEIRDDVDVKELKVLTKQIVQENYELKRTVASLTKAINHVKEK